MDIRKLVRKNILELTPYSSARKEFKGKARIFMDANESPFDTGYNRYPDPLQLSLKQKISDWRNFPSDQIFLGNGSDEAIDLLIRIFCEPGQDEIFLLPPTYGMYKVCANISGVAVKNIPLNTDFQPDVETILDRSNSTSKLLFLCSPNNPTANTFEASKITQLLSGFPGMVIIDEAYIDFADQESWLTKIQEFPNLVVLQTFSKAWGLAGLRLGMAFAQQPMIELLNNVKPPYNVNQLTQEKALEALENKKRLHLYIKGARNQREILRKELEAYPFVQKIYPSDTNFLLVKVTDADSLYHFLRSQSIIVRNRSTLPGCEGCLRITVGTPKENEILLATLNHYQQA